jgi:hypothetical protein
MRSLQSCKLNAMSLNVLIVLNFISASINFAAWISEYEYLVSTAAAEAQIEKKR